jgi:hypothetical protein
MSGSGWIRVHLVVSSYIGVLTSCFVVVGTLISTQGSSGLLASAGASCPPALSWP